MTDGQEKISFGKGQWLEMIQGKAVLNKIVNSACFKIPTNDRKQLTNKEKLTAIANDLLKQDDNILHPDFVELRNLISKRVNES